MGALTLTFFMGLVIGSLFGLSVPITGRFAVITVLALGVSLSASFLTGRAHSEGRLAIPGLNISELTFSVTGGIAAFFLIFILGYLIYVRGGQPDVTGLRDELARVLGPQRARQSALDQLLSMRVTDLHGVVLAELTLPRAGWEQINMTDSDLHDIRWDYAAVHSANLTRVDLSGSTLLYADFRTTSFAGAVFDHACAEHANFEDDFMRNSRSRVADFRYADFAGANLDIAEFTDCSMQDASFENAVLTSALIVHSDLTGADLRSANLSGATGLETDNLRGAIYDSTTSFPRRFDAAVHGLIKMHT